MRHQWMVPCVLALMTLSSASAFGQTTEAKKEAARELATKGFVLAKEGKYEEAIEAFIEADSRFHAPTILLMLAEAQEKAGRLLAAQATYRKIIAETFEEYAPPEFL